MHAHSRPYHDPVLYQKRRRIVTVTGTMTSMTHLPHLRTSLSTRRRRGACSMTVTKSPSSRLTRIQQRTTLGLHIGIFFRLPIDLSITGRSKGSNQVLKNRKSSQFRRIDHPSCHSLVAWTGCHEINQKHSKKARSPHSTSAPVRGMKR